MKHNVHLATGRLQLPISLCDDLIAKRLEIDPLFTSGDRSSQHHSLWQLNQVPYLHCPERGYMHLYDPKMGKIYLQDVGGGHYKVSEFQEGRKDSILPGQHVYRKITAVSVDGSYILTLTDKTKLHFRHIARGEHVLKMKEMADKSCFLYEFDGKNLRKIFIAKHKDAEKKSLIFISEYSIGTQKQIANGYIQGGRQCAYSWNKERLTRKKNGLIDPRPFVLSLLLCNGGYYELFHERFRAGAAYQLTKLHRLGLAPLEIRYHDYKADDFLGKITYTMRSDGFQIDKVLRISRGGQECLYFNYSLQGPFQITTVYGQCGKKEEHFFNIDHRLEKIRLYINDEQFYEIRYRYDQKKDLFLLTRIDYLNEEGVLVTSFEYEYNDAFSLISKSENGLTVRYSYDNLDRVQSVLEPKGLIKKFSYLKDSNLVTQELFCDQEGQVIKRVFYGYDIDFQKILEINDDGCSYLQDDLSGVSCRLIKKILPHSDPAYLGQPLEIHEGYYDSQKGGFSLLKRKEFYYKSFEGPRSIKTYNSKNELMYEQKMGYSGYGKLSNFINEKGNEFSYQYDRQGRLTHEHDHSVMSHTYFTYNELDHLIQKKTLFDDGHEDIYIYIYDQVGRCVTKKEPNNIVRSYSYDRFDRKTGEILEYEGNRVVFEKEFDLLGNIITKKRDGVVLESSTYNKNNQLEKRCYHDGSFESYMYNGFLQVQSYRDRLGIETRYRYDLLSRVTHEESYSTNKVLFKSKIRRYSGLHLLEEKVGSSVKRFAYDDAARLSFIDQDGFCNFYIYDENNQLYAKRVGSVYEIEKKDVFGRIVEKKVCDREKNIFRHLSFCHDSHDRVLKRTIHGDDKLITEEFEFDLRGRLIQKLDNYSEQITIHYSRAGHSREIFYPDGRVLEECFNSLGCLIRRTCKSKLGFITKEQSYFYDLLGNKTYELDYRISPEATLLETTSYSYDIENRVTRVEGPHKNVGYDYYPDGQIKTIYKGDGIRLDYERDERALLSRAVSSDSSIDYQLIYDDDLQLIHALDLAGDCNVSREYDQRGRVIHENIVGSSIGFSYDELSRVERIDLLDKSRIQYYYNPYFLEQVVRFDAQNTVMYRHTYDHFDKTGKLKQESLIGGLGKVVYEYDLLERMKKITSKYHHYETLLLNDSNHVSELRKGDEVLHFSYDALCQMTKCRNQEYLFDSCYHKIYQTDNVSFDEANRVNRSDERKFTYDARDRLIELQTDKSLIRYGYDFFDRRVKKEIFDLDGNKRDSEYYYYWDTREIGSIKEGKIHELRVLGVAKEGDVAGAVSIELGGKVYAPLHDLMGSIKGLVSLKNKNDVQRYTYDEFAHGDFSQIPCPWLYSSKRVDAEAGLIFFSRRYFDPSLNMFITPDPLPMNGVNNPYIFSLNNPLSFYDAWGLENKESGFNIAKGIFEYFISSDPFVNVTLSAAVENMGYNHLTRQPPSMQLSVIGNGDNLGEAKAFYINGIMTSQTEAQETALAVSSSINHSVTCVYNTSRGFKADLVSFALNKLNLFDMPIVRGLRSQMQEAIIGGAPRVYLFAHSEGAVIAKNALRRMNRSSRNKIEVYTFGSPSIINNRYASNVTNFYSTRDAAVALSPLCLLMSNFERNKYSVEFIPSTCEVFVDHSIMDSTYKKRLESVATNISLNYGK